MEIIKVLVAIILSYCLIYFIDIMATSMYPPANIVTLHVKYGQSYHLENHWSHGKSYLDICDQAVCSATTKYSVVTDKMPDRSRQKTGTWKIESATGLADGTTLSVGDLIYLRNQWSSGEQSYLDLCGPASSSNKYPMVTDLNPDRAGVGTGTWKIESAKGSPDGTPVSVGDVIYLHNQWTGMTPYLAVDCIASSLPTTRFTVVGDMELNEARTKTKTYTWKFISLR